VNALTEIIFPDLNWKEEVMSKSLKGKEFDSGISQRKGGLYQAGFMNRFGKRQTIYVRIYTEVDQKLRVEQYEDEKQFNVTKKDITLDEWYNIWLNACKKNCRNSTESHMQPTINEKR